MRSTKERLFEGEGMHYKIVIYISYTVLQDIQQPLHRRWINLRKRVAVQPGVDPRPRPRRTRYPGPDNRAPEDVTHKFPRLPIDKCREMAGAGKPLYAHKPIQQLSIEAIGKRLLLDSAECALAREQPEMKQLQGVRCECVDGYPDCVGAPVEIIYI